MITLNDDVVAHTFRFLSVIKRGEKPSELMNVALTCKRFHRLALKTLQDYGYSRSFYCCYDLLDTFETRLQVLRISHLDSLSLDLSRFSSAYLEVLREAPFATTLKTLKIASNQPAALNEKDVENIKKFLKLKTLELQWFFYTAPLTQLSGLSIFVIEPSRV